MLTLNPQEEDGVRNPLLKIWHLEKTDKNGVPSLLRSTKVQTSNRPHPVRLPSVLFTL